MIPIRLMALYISEQQSNIQKRFKHRIDRKARRRRDRRITRRALQHPHMSAFVTLFGSGCNQSLITLTGFDHCSFRYLLLKFEPLYNKFSPYSKNGDIKVLERNTKSGRPRSMNAAQCLRLLLAWNRTRGADFVLCMLFGITGSVCSLFVRFGRPLLLKALRGDRHAAIRMPTGEEVNEYQMAFESKHPALYDVYCVADGLKLYLEQSGDFIIQNMFYNGWTHDHYVGNVLVFAPNGVVIACSLNALGAMHDSIIAEWGGVYEKLQITFERLGAHCVVDSAFCKGTYPYLIKSSQDCVTNSDGSLQDMTRLRQATSARQASEWDMRAFKATFTRLRDRFVYEERGERKLMLQAVVLLHNLRSRLVGINQILNTYMPHLSVEANHFLFR